MVTQRDVLTYIAKRSVERPGITAEDLVRRFWMSRDSACRHLKRLWRDRLVETDSMRRRGFRFRPEPGEPILQLHFSLAARGKERVRWYELQDEQSEDGFRLFR
jgi:DNA-binding transcriptional ArsR family regulator